jgi:hypothetical protein
MEGFKEKMNTLIWIALIAVGWTICGSIVLSAINKNLEITM